jgi:hypothetical protein
MSLAVGRNIRARLLSGSKRGDECHGRQCRSSTTIMDVQVAENRSRGYGRGMTIYPEMQLSHLREIGWRLWDPIGMGDENGSCHEGCADEYDRYLLHVASLICRGGSTDEAATYLIGIASEQMGLSVVDAGAAAATSEAIAGYLAFLSGAI